MAEKTGRNGDDERLSNFGIKLNVHVLVQYVDSHMARSHRLTCLQTEVNNL